MRGGAMATPGDKQSLLMMRAMDSEGIFGF